MGIQYTLLYKQNKKATQGKSHKLIISGKNIFQIQIKKITKLIAIQKQTLYVTKF